MERTSSKFILSGIFFVLFSIGGYFANEAKKTHYISALEQRKIETIVQMHRFEAGFEKHFYSILDRTVTEPISVRRTIQIFKKEDDVLVLVADSKEPDTFLAEVGRTTFKKTFLLDDLKFYSTLEAGLYELQEQWEFELQYNVRKHIEFKADFILSSYE